MEQSGLLEMRHISKEFPGVKALDDVHLDIRAGEVHALIGENGAGKSTLMNILSGSYLPDQGEILLRGQPVHFTNPNQARKAGISIIHQELNLVPEMNAAQNIFLGTNLGAGPLGLVDRRQRQELALNALRELNIAIDIDTPIRRLSVAHQQMIEIAKALSIKSDILVMDEPTSALTDREIETLYGVIRSLRERGVAIIYISHRLEEIFDLSDRITILRDGRNVATEATQNLSMDSLVRMMVGRELQRFFHRDRLAEQSQAQQPLLEVKNLYTRDRLKDVSFKVYPGEIFGIAGLVGAGRTDLVRAIFGADPLQSGSIYIAGRQVTIKSPRDAVRLGLGFVPEDRKSQGLVLERPVVSNATLTILDRISAWGIIRQSSRQEVAGNYVQKLAVKTPSLDQTVKFLSGGNQQKIVIAKWLASQARILIFDEPTRGIDVGAKVEVRELMNELVKQGVVIILISSELPEVLGMCDRVMVVCEGRVTGEFDARSTSEAEILHYASGLTSEFVATN